MNFLVPGVQWAIVAVCLAAAAYFYNRARKLEKQGDAEQGGALLQARYHYVIEADPRAILLFQPDLTLVEINQMGRDWLKGTQTELYGKTMLEVITRLQPDLPQDLLDKIMHKAAIELKVGERILSDFEWTELFDEQGGRVGGVLCFRDVTEEKKFQREIIQSEKLAVVGQLAAAMAHEIRNPLTSIKGFLQLLHRLKTMEQEGEIKEYTRIMVEEVDRMEKIIRDFLLMTKPSDVIRETISLNTVIERVLVLVQNQAILRNIHVHTDLCELPPVLMHKEAIQQVVLNLMQNALEAMNVGGTLTVRTEEEDKYVKLQVIDTGIGMTDEEIQNLGSPFYSTKTEGTGLGLTVSSKIIKEHRGQLDVQSEKGVGTTITIRLPK
ncbi:signal transduction histidine kinase [Tumebacillus sp. BK434]|uniref:two-component system sensor histidine kinase NtrB n=1 Tax=Tumebacillus sp. BK434 TaxID=2512169 RepID=UPI0010F3BCE9|nr:ATP-binding protein [Tumebacillus sp. BK434]TCP58252.1 signal transduction histidine kinase [Tumebacillus sp. BK434]